METYEEKYKKALEKAKQLSKELTVDDIIEQIFPELAESEEEKTKRLLHTIANKMGQHLRDIFTEEEYQCFDAWSNAWLEKQGEKEKFIKKELDCIRGYRKEAIRRLQELEKQGESTEINPSEFDLQLNRLLKQFKSLPKEDLASSLSFYLNVVQNDGTYKEEKQGEQKHQYNSRPKYIGEEELLGEQKPAEWSEEDEEISEAIIKRIKGESEALSVSLSSAISWVGNIKDRVQLQSQWKPSDEQIKALNYVINLMASSESSKENDYYYNVFKGLREQLKKL